MAYLGNVPARSFISFERQVFTIVNSQTAYTLSHSVTNENDIRLVVNNIVQEPGSGKAYTASGTTLALSAALVNGTDEMYCVFLGRAVGTVNAPAGSVSTSQLAGDAVTEAKIADGAVESEHLNNNVISGQTELATEPADTDEFLVSDAGTLKRIDYSYIKPSSDFVFVSTTTISSAVAQVDIDFDYSTYKEIFLFVEGLQATADGNVYARFKISGSINTSNVYASNTIKKYYAGLDSATYGGQNQSYMYVTNDLGGDTYESWSAQMRILLGSGVGMPFIDLCTSYKASAGNYDQNMGSLTYQNFNQVQGIRLYHSAGNLDTGKIHMYGVK